MPTPESIVLASGRRQIVYKGGEGPPLLWLHGLSGVEEDAPLLDKLTPHRAVLAPLTPGFNDLSELDDIRDVHDLAMHYEDLVDALGLDQVAVAGHSFGAMIGA